MADDLADLLARTDGDAPDVDQVARMWAGIASATRPITDIGGIPVTTIEAPEERLTTGSRRRRVIVRAAAVVAVLLGATIVARPGSTGDDAIVATESPSSTEPSDAADEPIAAADDETTTSTSPDPQPLRPVGPGPLESVLSLWLEEGAEAALSSGNLPDSILTTWSPFGSLTWGEWLAFYEGAAGDPVLECRFDVGSLVGELCVVDADGPFTQLFERRERFGMLLTSDDDGVPFLLGFRGRTEAKTDTAYTAWIRRERPEQLTDQCYAAGWECVYTSEALRSWAESDFYTDQVEDLIIPGW